MDWFGTTKKRPVGSFFLVPGEGVEPSIPCGPRILSPVRMPVPPPRLSWRCRPELNRCKGFCRPSPNHSATTPRHFYSPALGLHIICRPQVFLKPRVCRGFHVSSRSGSALRPSAQRPLRQRLRRELQASASCTCPSCTRPMAGIRESRTSSTRCRG